MCFRADRKTNMTALTIDWLRYSRLFLCTHCTLFNKNYRKQYLNVVCQVCVFGANRQLNISALASDLLRHFRPQTSKLSTFATKHMPKNVAAITDCDDKIWNYGLKKNY